MFRIYFDFTAHGAVSLVLGSTSVVAWLELPSTRRLLRVRYRATCGSIFPGFATRCWAYIIHLSLGQMFRWSILHISQISRHFCTVSINVSSNFWLSFDFSINLTPRHPLGNVSTCSGFLDLLSSLHSLTDIHTEVTNCTCTKVSNKNLLYMVYCDEFWGHGRVV